MARPHRRLRAMYSGRCSMWRTMPRKPRRAVLGPSSTAIGVSLYPPLGADDDRDGRRSAMRAAADRLDALAARTGKSDRGRRDRAAFRAGRRRQAVGKRRGAHASPDPSLQAEVLADWLAVLDRPTIHGVLIWRWFTDPDAGGLADTDFTVQGKPAERVLLCAWTQACERDDRRPHSP